MPRLLICGDVLGKFDVLFKRCTTLNNSKAGPFDMILVAGAFFSDDGTGDLESIVQILNTSPLPIYFCDPRGAPKGLLGIPNSANTQWPVSLESAPCVHWLGSGGVVMVGTLTVAFLSPTEDVEVGLKKLKELCSKGVYMGADILLTPEWPAGLASTLPPNGPHISVLPGLGVHIDGVGESSAAEAAKFARPRYHFSSSENVFYQRQPYRCRADAGSAISSNRQSCITRFIGLGTVEPGKTDKDRKWLHALALEAIPFMSAEALKEEPAGTTDSPFQLNTSKASSVMGVKEPMEGQGGQEVERADTGAFFFGADKKGAGQMGSKRRKRDDDGDNEDNDTLYLGPIPQGVTSEVLRGQLVSVIPGIDAVLLSVNVPNNKTFGFAQFNSHEAAKEAMYALEGLQFVKARWGKPRDDTQKSNKPPLPPGPPPAPPSGPPTKKPNNMEDQAELATYSNVLFLGFPSVPPVSGASPEEASSLLQLELQRSIAASIPSLKESLDSKVLKVRAFPGKTYAFLEFPDNESAAAALPTFGGVALQFSLGEGYFDTLLVTAKWGKPRQPPTPRPKYEADSRVDCWFCLASSTCEAHLVASIANDFYLTLPKGSLCEGHVLTIPIPHGGTHAQLSEVGQAELLSYKQALAKCYHTSYGGAGMVVFERFADTRGTYHMHQQIVPVAANMTGAARKAFERSGKRQNLNLEEVQGEVDMKDIGDDFYFYVEIWAPSGVAASYPTCRLLHRAKDSRIPVQFGREVLAGVLGHPERAFWKACEVSKQAEADATESFKQVFSSFDPFLA